MTNSEPLDGNRASSGPTTETTIQGLFGREGSSLGTTAWHTLDQKTIDTFARITRDEQWIHVDPVRSATGPFGATVAHGYLTLSLCAGFLSDCLNVTDARIAINYGVDRVRFPAPVLVGTKIRGNVTLVSLEGIAGGVHAVLRIIVEVDPGPKPACVADAVLRFLR